MELTINIKCDELVKAINRICDAMIGGAVLNSTSQAPQIEAKKEMAKAEKEAVKKEPETEKTTEETITVEEVRAGLAKLSKTKGKEVAKGLLSDFGVSKITELEENQYSDFLNAIKEA